MRSRVPSAVPPAPPAPPAPPGSLRALSTGLRLYVAGIPAAALALAVLLVVRTPLAGHLPGHPPGHDAAVGLLLLAAGALSVEITRRVGQPAGTMVRDLLSVWWLPLAVLLPPVWVLLAPAPLLALTQWRVQRSPAHRRVYSAACVGLAYAGASAVFGAVLPRTPGAGTSLLAWAAGVAAAGVLGAAGNALLVAVAVRASDPQVGWRTLLLLPENLRLEGAEACVGVIVAVLVAAEPALVVLVLPPVLLLQRGLLHEQLRSVASLDAKTGLLHAVAWEREAAGTLLALRRRRQPAAVLLVDVDHFKRVNDEHGHLAGDRVLRAVAEVLRAGVRDGDLAGRFGGEEFVALLPGADARETAHVAERLRADVAGLVVPLGAGATAQVTVSVGGASTPDGALSVPDLLAAADAEMYRAKAAGRNRVGCTQPAPPA